MKTGHELFDYYTSKKDDYASIVKLLPFVVGFNEAELLLERLEKEGKQLVVLYGEEASRSTFEYVGEVSDGAMFIA